MSGFLLAIDRYGNEKSAGGGIMLPAPKVQIYNASVRPNLFVSDGYPSGGSTIAVTPTRYVKVTVPGIPQDILDKVTVYEPMVELLRYTRLRTRENGDSITGGVDNDIIFGGKGSESSGFVHPSHGPAASGNGSFTHGGVHGGVGAAVQAIRPTEWPILAGNDAIDVTQGILGFMCLIDVNYRLSDGNNSNSVKAVVPSHGLSRGRGGSFSRFPYQKVLSGAYYSFRLSVKDVSDSRGKRIHGPMSEIIYCGNTKFPFTPDGVDDVGRAAARIVDGYDPRSVNFWFDQRKPG